MRLRPSSRLRCLAASLLLFGVVLLPAVAHADATDPQAPTIVSPADGSSVPNGFYGPFEVDFTGAEYGTYDMDLECGSGYSWDEGFTWDGSQNPIYTWTIDPLTDSGEVCELYIQDFGSVYTQSDFTVEDPPVKVTDTSMSPATFYPEVHDGYRDDTTFNYAVSADAAAKITVTSDATGQTVRSAQQQSYGPSTWTWNGRDGQTGNLVPTGNYTLHLTVTDQWGYTASATKAITVATGWKTEPASQFIYGIQTSRRWHSPRCSTTNAGTSVRLRCLGGRAAGVRWRFTVPADVPSARYSAPYTLLASDEPRHGRVQWSAGWADETHFWVQLRITGWRAISVHSLRLAYNTSVRI